MTTIYGTPIALGVREGDVNAVALCVGMYQAIFDCLGLPEVPLCNVDDGKYFVNELLTCEPIEKQGQSDGTHTFESGGYSSVDIKFGQANSGSSLTVVDDPEDEENKALYFVSVGSDKAGDGVEFRPASHGSSCYIFETDIYVSKDSANSQLYQVKIGELFMLEFTKSGSTVKIEADQDATTGAGEEFLGEFDVDTWITIRIECYPANDETGLTIPELKLWLDGELVAVSENYIGFGKRAPSDLGFTQVQIYMLMSASGTSYFDNTFISKEDKIFDEYDDSLADSRNP
jgi:hypothetical protein